MNKILIALFAGYLLGNDKIRYELNNSFKNFAAKTVDAFNEKPEKEGEPNAHSTPPKKILQDEQE